VQVSVALVSGLLILGLSILAVVVYEKRAVDNYRLMTAYVGATILAVLVRIPYMTLTPAHDDSNIYLADIETIARDGSLAVSEVEHLGVELVMAAFYLVFGEAGPNLASLIAALATVPAMGLVARSLFDSDRIGVLTAVLVAMLPSHIYYSSLLLMEPISLFVFALVLLATVKRRWVAVGVLSAVLLFMRLEHLLITVPFVVLWWTESKWVRHSIITFPFALLFGGILLGSLIHFSPQESQLFYKPVAQHLPISTSFIGRFLRRPDYHLHKRIAFYVPQMLYWGVPFFSLPLMNPTFPILSLICVRKLSSRDVWTSRVLYLLPVGVCAVFLHREAMLDGDMIFLSRVIPPIDVTTVILGAVIAGAYARLAWTADDPRLAPFSVLGPYITLLMLQALAPRYLLPVFLVGTLYAGYGLHLVLQRANVERYVRAIGDDAEIEQTSA
jgi:hypothetical protein